MLFWFLLNYVMNNTYDVGQFKRQVSKSSKSQSVVTEVKYHLVEQ